MRQVAVVALWLFVFTIPWEATVALDGGMASVARFTGVLAFALGACYLLLRGRVRRLTPIHICFGALVLTYGASCCWSSDVDATLFTFAIVVQLLIMMWLISQLTSTDRGVHNLFFAYILGCGVSIAGTFYGLMTHTGKYVSNTSTRYVADGFDPNDLALVLSLGIPISCYLGHRAKSIWLRALLFYGYPATALFAILLTGSRGGALAASASLLVYPLLSRSGSVIIRSAVTVLVVASVILLLWVAPTESIMRLRSISDEMSGGTFSQRTVIWRAGIDQFSQTPLLGVGGGAYAQMLQGRIGVRDVSHNTILTVAVEFGLVGVSLVLAIAAASWHCLRRLQRNERTLWLVLLLTWFIGNMGLNWIYRKPTWLMFALLAVHSHAPHHEAWGDSEHLCTVSSRHENVS